MLDKRGSRAAALKAAAQVQQILNDEAKRADADNVAQIQSQINKVTGVMSAEPSTKNARRSQPVTGRRRVAIVRDRALS